MGLQNQLDYLKREADRLYLTVNLEEKNFMAFRVSAQLATREMWLYGNAVVKVTNAYKYLGMIFTQIRDWAPMILSSAPKKG